MKLYTRGQVIFIALLSTILVLLLFVGVGLFRLPFTNQRKADNRVPSIQEVSQSEPFLLQTNPKIPEEIVRVNGGETYTEDELDNIRVYESVNDAVVNINTETVALNWFLEPVPGAGSTGSGSIIDKRGYVLTNRHVVENAYKVFITLSDGEQYEGKVVGTDPENDLSVVKFDPKGKSLATIPFGDSSKLKVGQKVLAIGNPFGYERTLTTGVISGLGRPVKPSADSPYIIQEMIQTDASINPGNSGGPLLNSQGQMIAINTMIYSPTGGSVGIGFAVPVDTARRVVPELLKYGKVRRGWIDLRTVQLFPELVRFAKISVNKGLLVSEVTKGGNAEQSGIRGGSKLVRYGRSTFYVGGDIITEIGGKTIATYSDLYSALEESKPGEVVQVVVMRKSQKMKFNVKLSERKKEE